MSCFEGKLPLRPPPLDETLACDMTLFFYAGEAIVLCGDRRCDSPGSSAKFCSYTLMDVKTNAIMHTETVTREQVSCVFCCCFMKL